MKIYKNGDRRRGKKKRENDLVELAIIAITPRYLRARTITCGHESWRADNDGTPKLAKNGGSHEFTGYHAGPCYTGHRVGCAHWEEDHAERQRGDKTKLGLVTRGV